MLARAVGYDAIVGGNGYAGSRMRIYFSAQSVYGRCCAIAGRALHVLRSMVQTHHIGDTYRDRTVYHAICG